MTTDESIVRSDMYHIDEFLISSFCPNTVKAFNKELDKFVLFKSMLNSFHDDGDIYENSLEDYANYITYQIIKDALLLQKNILTYEAYLYNVLTSFSEEKLNKKINPKNIAKVWNNIVTIMARIVEVSSSENILEINYLPEIIVSKKHINVQKMNSNYFLKPLMVLFFKDGVEVINIIPSFKNHFIFNINNQEIIKYFGKSLKKIHIFELTSKLSCEPSVLTISDNLLNKIKNLTELQYIDFKKINTNNCNNCPLSCTVKEILYSRYEPIPYNVRRKTIKTFTI